MGGSGAAVIQAEPGGQGNHPKFNESAGVLLTQTPG